MGRNRRNQTDENQEFSSEPSEYNDVVVERADENSRQSDETAIMEIGDRDIIAKPMGEGIALSFDFDAEPIFVGVDTQKYGIGLAVRKIADLVDKPIVLYAARQFKSSFENQDYAYYAICKDWYSGEMFATVWGSRSLSELIESAALARFNRPLAFVIKYKDRGVGRSYYYYEPFTP